MLELFKDSPILCTILIFLFAEILLKITCRLFRCLQILVKGWPPAHLDADGDFREDE